MTTKFFARTFVPVAIAGATFLMAIAPAAHAAAARAETEDFIDARVLEVSGQTFLSAQETVKARRAAIVRAEAEKGATAVAKAQEVKSVPNN